MSLRGVLSLFKTSSALLRPLCNVQSGITQPSSASRFRRCSTFSETEVLLGQSYESPEKVNMKKKIVFTCKICNTRNENYFSNTAYTNGIVVIRCSGCSNRHLIADNLKVFGSQKRNIEDILAEKGITVEKKVVEFANTENINAVSPDKPYLFPTTENETK